MTGDEEVVATDALIGDDDAPIHEDPGTFLDALAQKVSEQTEDTAVAAILASHILKAAPAENGVEQAAKAICALADQRATAAEASDD